MNLQEHETDASRELNVPTCLHADELSITVSNLVALSAEKILIQKSCEVLDMYMEEPTLLDPHLHKWIPALCKNLLCTLNNEYCEQNRAQFIYTAKFLYYLCKVRGVNVVLSHFPHAIDDVVPALLFTMNSLCESSSEEDFWIVRYVSILMGASVMHVPFDLSKFERRFRSLSNHQNISDFIGRLFDLVLEKVLTATGRERDAAVLFWSKVVRRPDSTPQMFSSVINSCIFVDTTLPPTSLDVEPQSFEVHLTMVKNCSISNNSSLPIATSQIPLNQFKANEGALKCLCLIIKHEPKFAIQNSAQILEIINILRQLKSQSTILHKIFINLTGKLAFLDPSRIDHHLDELLFGLRDHDTSVRTKAAKALWSLLHSNGNDANIRIIFDHLIEAIDSSMHCLALPDTSMLHGMALALAELIKRQIIPVDCLKKVFSQGIFTYLLKFDIPRGRSGIGSAVRDAACYIVWGMVRKYTLSSLSPIDSYLKLTAVKESNDGGDQCIETACSSDSILSPNSDQLKPDFPIQTIFGNLLCTAMLDREVGCRRAGAAALQEFVGRWALDAGVDALPGAISILEKVNFFSVSSRKFAFEIVAPTVCIQNLVYANFIIDHLLDRSLVCWDRLVRELAAHSLAKILVGLQATVDGDRFKSLTDRVIKVLCSRAFDLDSLTAQHGAILALAYVSGAGFRPLSKRLRLADDLARKINFSGPKKDTSNSANDEKRDYLELSSEMLLMLKRVSMISTELSSKMLGWEMIIETVCELICSLACRSFSIGTSMFEIKTAKIWMNDLYSVLSSSREDSVHEVAFEAILNVVNALEYRYSKTFYNVIKEPSNVDLQISEDEDRKAFISDYFRKNILPAADKDRSIHAQKACALAIGAMPAWLIQSRMDPLSKLLFKMVTSSTSSIEKRINALHSLERIYNTMFVTELPIDCPTNHSETSKILIENTSNIKKLLEDAFFEAMQDYTVDARGDIGSHLRLVAIEKGKNIFHHDSRTTYISILMMNMCDKLDKLRILSATQLKSLDMSVGKVLDTKLENSGTKRVGLFETELPNFVVTVDSASDYKSFISQCIEPTLTHLIQEKYSDQIDELVSMFEKSLLNPQSGLQIILYALFGLISAAGSTSPGYSEPASQCIFSILRHKGPKFMEDLLQHTFDAKPRLERPILHFVDLYIKKLEGEEILSRIRIRFLDKSNAVPMSDIMASARIFAVNSSRSAIAREWIKCQGVNHPFPRVREIFTNFQ